jgi:hypothetical protein
VIVVDRERSKPQEAQIEGIKKFKRREKIG